MDDVIVLAVSPRLLSDTIKRMLDLDGLHVVDVELVVEGQSADVAVVTTGRESEVRARTVITLAGDGAQLEPAGGIRVRDLSELRLLLAGLGPVDLQ